MNYEMPKMDIMELEQESMISTLTSTRVDGGGDIGFTPNPNPEEDWD